MLDTEVFVSNFCAMAMNVTGIEHRNPIIEPVNGHQISTGYISQSIRHLNTIGYCAEVDPTVS
jgi:hypothetical protein